MRLLLAILVAPLGTMIAVPATLLVYAALDIDHWLYDADFLEQLEGGIRFGVLATLFAYPVMFLLGLPGIALARWKGWFDARHFAALGAAIGALPFIAACALELIFRIDGSDWSATLDYARHEFAGAMRWIGLGSAAGAACALLYWWAAPVNDPCAP